VMSRMRPLAFGVEIMLLTMHFVVVTVASGTLRLPLNGNKFPLTVKRVRIVTKALCLGP